jgi:hypothetical protein
MKKLILFFTITFLFTFVHATLVAQTISITGIYPDSPSSLTFNQKVTINFNYSLRNQNAIQIFMRPVTSGKLTPNYSASGSPLYRGKGTGTASFTVTAGNIEIDQIRVQVLSSPQNRLIFEFYVPVDFTYSSAVFTLLKPQLIDRGAVTARSQLYELLTPSDTLSVSGQEVKRTITKEGIIEIHYSDGNIKGIISWDHWYTIDPVTGDTSYTKLMLNQVQGTSQPADPPGFGTTVNTSVDEEWLSSLNTWIEYLGNELLFSIENQIRDPDSFENYKLFENENSSTLYERVNLRYTFLKKLLQSGS